MVDLSKGLGCGGYSYEIIYLDGPKLDKSFTASHADLSEFNLVAISAERMEVTGVVEDRSWLGIHTIQIKATNGKYDNRANARGDKGLFSSVFSASLRIQIIDPCEFSVVNGDGLLDVVDIEVPEGQAETRVSYKGPTNTASAKYGNGYDVCGELVYELLGPDGQLFSDERLFFERTVDPSGADAFSLTLESEKVGTEVAREVTLQIKLRDFPGSTKASFPIQLINRECHPADFTMPSFEDIEVKVSEVGPTLDLFTDQAPCTWRQTYSINVVYPNGASKTSLPTFITLQST